MEDITLSKLSNDEEIFIASGSSVPDMIYIGEVLSTCKTDKLKLFTNEKFWSEGTGNFNIRTIYIFEKGRIISVCTQHPFDR